MDSLYSRRPNLLQRDRQRRHGQVLFFTSHVYVALATDPINPSVSRYCWTPRIASICHSSSHDEWLQRLHCFITRVTIRLIIRHCDSVSRRYHPSL